MSPRDSNPLPLEATDPKRARTLKLKIRDRANDVRRHLLALRTAMAEFGDDFDRDVFAAAFASEDPVVLNRVKAVERGVEQLYACIVELAAFGLELAELRGRRDEADMRGDLTALRRAGVLSTELTRRLRRLGELWRMLARQATADHVHEAALLVTANFPAFYGAFGDWARRGFSIAPGAASSPARSPSSPHAPS
jgi:hypothetical protein